QLPKVYEQLLALLCNDSTRLSVVVATRKVHKCGVPPAVLVKMGTELAANLRKADRTLRDEALKTLEVVIPAHHGWPAELFSAILTEVANPNTSLLGERELYTTILTVKLLKALVDLQAVPLAKQILPILLRLYGNPIVQGDIVRHGAELVK